MSNEVRGSEKLKMRCRSMQELTMEDLDKVVGAGLVLQWQPLFPKGIPWPDLFVKQPLVINPTQGMVGP